MKKLFAAALLIAVVLCTGCGGGDKEMVVENGHEVIDLPSGEKLVDFACDQYSKFVIHRKRQKDEAPEEYTIDVIDSNRSIYSSRYIIREH